MNKLESTIPEGASLHVLAFLADCFLKRRFLNTFLYIYSYVKFEPQPILPHPTHGVPNFHNFECTLPGDALT